MFGTAKAQKSEKESNKNIEFVPALCYLEKKIEEKERA